MISTYCPLIWFCIKLGQFNGFEGRLQQGTLKVSNHFCTLVSEAKTLYTVLRMLKVKGRKTFQEQEDRQIVKVFHMAF